MSKETFAPPTLKGKHIKFKKEKKKDKLKKLFGENLIGIEHSGDDITLLFKPEISLSQSDKEKIQRIVDGE